MSKQPTNDSVDLDITESQDFRDALRDLLVTAYENDVEVNGGWPVTPETDGPPAWDVEITPLSRQTTHQAPETEQFPLDAILSAVASREGVPETELPPLQQSVDVDSLERVFSDLGDGMPGEVTFQYCSYTITVHADGRITIEG